MPTIPGSDAVTRTFRRILSGEDDGRPPWVRALEKPGDAGWFGEGSTMWAVHGSLATLVGGVRALYLQAAHPLALTGVEEHSDYREDPLGRLHRTNRFVTTVTFGSSELASGAVDAVKRAHGPVRGLAPDGRAYDASDPHLLLWVHLALTDSMLVAARTFGPTDVDPDEYVASMAVVGRALGVLDPPTTSRELDDALVGFVPELGRTTATTDVVSFLSTPHGLPTSAKPAYQVLARAAVDLLPPWAHGVLGTLERPGWLRAADVRAASVLLGGLRTVLGPTGPGERAALTRIEGCQPSSR